VLVPLLSLLSLASPPSAPQESGEAAPASGAALFSALAFADTEREERLALALSVALSGDCEGALTWLGVAGGSGSADDELGRRLATERTRLAAWIELRDSFLAELVQSGKPLVLELDGKKVSTTFTREGDELVLARAPRPRLRVRELAPEALLPAIPKERFAGAKEWLKIYPYCVAANPKWKRLTTSDSASAELKRDAEAFYPRLALLGPSVRAIDKLARRAPPADAVAARAALAEIGAMLALGREPACVQARLPALGALADHLLKIVADALELGELVHGTVTPAEGGTVRLAYDFTSPAQAEDWLRDEGYLASLRSALEPVHAVASSTAFPVGPKGFSANGEFCWRHALEFQAPMHVRYRLRWEPGANQANKVFSFALGMLGDEGERHVRVNELGFLYVDEQDGRYTAVRPTGNATVQLGQTYALELVHDGEKVAVSVDGTLRAEAAAKERKAGHVFLWGHSDVAINVSALEIEGHVTPASLAKLRADWARAELERLGLGPGR
jgi:hypothetical protein